MKLLKRSLCLVLTLLLIATLFCACADEDEPGASGSGEGSYTVFLYLCGTDLESEGGAATSNLDEILSVNLGDDVNFVIQTGGTSEWMTEGIDSSLIQRWIVSDGMLELVDEQESASMGDAETLGDFLSWGVESYPADNYMVTFWNHGGGSASGAAFDELYDGDSLSLVEIASGIAQAGVKFEVIGFDTCLMATLENAELLCEYGNYLVASEEYEPGGGWDYQSWLTTLASNPGIDGQNLGIAICDSYYEKCAANGEGEMATLSVIDLSQVPQLIEAFGEMTLDISGNVIEDVGSLQTFARGVAKAENYGGNTDEEGYTNMVDLGDLVSNTSEVIPQTADEVLACLYQAVVYQIKGENRSGANGLSVFYPLSSDDEMLDNYAAVTKNAAYLKYIDTICPNWDAPDWVYDEVEKSDSAVSSDDYRVSMSSGISDDGFYMLSIDSGEEIVESVNFTLYYMNNDSEEYIRLGLDNDINYDEDSGVYYDNFRGVWASIGGEYCAPELISEGDTYNLYSIPVVLNGEFTNIRAIYDFDKEEYSILGVYDGIDTETGMSSRDIKKLKDGDVIQFVFSILDLLTGEEEQYTMGEIVYSSDMALEEIDLFDGDYLYQYEITDIFGNTYYSDYVIMTCENGELYISEVE